MSERLDMLREFLRANPKDSFARYGLAMEYAKAGQSESAVAEFAALVAADPDYTAAYQMAGQFLLKAGRSEEARNWLERGIQAATRTGNQHARAEMEGLMEEIR